MSETQSKIRQFQLNASTWTAIVAPAGCNYYMIINSDSNPIHRTSDTSNAQAIHDIPAGQTYSLLAPPVAQAGGSRFASGETVTYLKSSSGTPTISVEFV